MITPETLLARYGDHDLDCDLTLHRYGSPDVRDQHPDTCSCGFSDALAAARVESDALRAALEGRINAIEHPCHESCLGDLHADCQCAAWMRQEALAAVAALAPSPAAPERVKTPLVKTGTTFSAFDTGLVGDAPGEWQDTAPEREP